MPLLSGESTPRRKPLPSVEMHLTRREAEALLKAELSVGYGVRPPFVLQVAEMKLRSALHIALQEDE